MRRTIIIVACTCFVATVWGANWLVNHYGPIRVWPSHLQAPAGVYMIGLAIVLRDLIQYRGSKRLALVCIAAGTALSIFVSPTLALASACAFAVSECSGLIVFWASQRRLMLAVLLAGAVGAALDSLVFLSIAFGSLSFFGGQMLAKLTMTVLAIPLIYAQRKTPAWIFG